MTPLLSLHDIAAQRPDGSILFEQVSFALTGETAGLVGPNGAGKSTLLSILAGDRKPASGHVDCQGRIGVLRQVVHHDAHADLATAFGVERAWARLHRIEAGTASLDDMSEADWDMPVRMEAALAEFGLSGLEPKTRLSRLSGGQGVRVMLAALFFREPDLILMDEPSNNLDRDGRDLLLAAVRRWRGGALIVSHDRELLDEMDAIYALDRHQVKRYGGNYTAYREQRAIEQEAAAHALDVARQDEKRIARQIQRTAERKARTDAAGRAERASGSQPRLVMNAKQERAESTGGASARQAEKMASDARLAVDKAAEEVAHQIRQSFDIAPCGLPAGRQVLTLDAVAGGWPEQSLLFEGVALSIRGPQRWRITGPNGVGKSTLLQIITGQLEPRAGSVVRGVEMALLDQTVSLLSLNASLVDNFQWLNPGATVNEARSALARFRFRNVMADRNAGDLSGGERLRAGLACVLARPQPVQALILDEPTNHLDLDAIEELEAALQAYDGAILAISHDERFLDAIGASEVLDMKKAARGGL